MITEDYVSFETAKLLKDKGFDWLESPFYSEQDRDEWRKNNSYTVPNEEYSPELPFDSETLTLVAPHVSIQIVMKWLREVHRLSIELLFDWGLDDELWWYVDVCKIKKNGLIDTLTGYDSYEEACEAAIKYCLENLI